MTLEEFQERLSSLCTSYIEQSPHDKVRHLYIKVEDGGYQQGYKVSETSLGDEENSLRILKHLNLSMLSFKLAVKEKYKHD